MHWLIDDFHEIELMKVRLMELMMDHVKVQHRKGENVMKWFLMFGHSFKSCMRKVTQREKQQCTTWCRCKISNFNRDTRGIERCQNCALTTFTLVIFVVFNYKFKRIWISIGFPEDGIFSWCWFPVGLYLHGTQISVSGVGNNYWKSA